MWQRSNILLDNNHRMRLKRQQNFAFENNELDMHASTGGKRQRFKDKSINKQVYSPPAENREVSPDDQHAGGNQDGKVMSQDSHNCPLLLQADGWKEWTGTANPDAVEMPLSYYYDTEASPTSDCSNTFALTRLQIGKTVV